MERGPKAEASCQIRLDRITVSVPEGLPKGLPELEGFKLVKDTLVRQSGAIRTYDRARWYRSEENACKVSISYQKVAPWLPVYKVTIYADDQTGITLDELKRVLVGFPDHRISLLEIAFDFHPDTPVNEAFVLRHMRFGKSQRQKTLKGPGRLRFGSRQSPKLVRCYWKPEIQRYRVELELHGSLLRNLAIRNVVNLPEVATRLCPAHICFERIDWDRLEAYLSRRYGKIGGERRSEEAREQAKISRSRARKFLSASVYNPHRFFQATVRNRTVQDALQRWADGFAMFGGGALIQ